MIVPLGRLAYEIAGQHMMKTIVFLWSFSLLACVQLGGDPIALPGEVGRAQQSIGNSAEVAGFVHRSASKMYIGDGVVTDEIMHFERLTGSDGVLAFGPFGTTLGIPNATSRAVLAPPFSGDGEAHNKAVLDYFKDSGLPREQIGNVQVGAALRIEGAISDYMAGKAEKPVFAGYTTLISRSVSNFPVRGSAASATINSHLQIVTESVYWPPFSSDLVAAAKSLDAELKDDERRRVFLTRFEPKLQDQFPRVVIKHSPYFQEAFQADVVLEFANSDYHYLPDGSLHRLDSELVK